MTKMNAGGRAEAPGGSAIDWLVCVAVPEEAAFVRGRQGPHVRILVTGMGQRNASRAIRKALEETRPRKVISAGFAGALNRDLKRGAIVFDADEDLCLEPALTAVGGRTARFYCSDRVVITREEKQALRFRTGADAVDMESSVIREACRANGVSSATVRVISDDADEDLPLDFNSLLTEREEIDGWKLARTIMARPILMGRLLKFHSQTRQAARELGRALLGMLGA